MANKVVHIIGGGTVFHVRNHFALCAPAYGGTARQLTELCRHRGMDVALHLTKMAGGTQLETNKDVADLLDKLTADLTTKIIFMPAALIDFEGMVGEIQPDKHAQRLHSRIKHGSIGSVSLYPSNKLLGTIRKNRKDIFLVGFKTTTEATESEQYAAGLNLLKESSSNLILANDVVTRQNMVITPEEAKYHNTKSRQSALQGLVEMAFARSHLTFTRSTVVNGERVPWESEMVPPSLRAVVNYCIDNNAYKPFRGSTVGHFACKISDTVFLTSIRKSNFNDLSKIGLVRVVTDGPDSVFAFGAKPSVGGQSQRIVFHDHPEFDCILHFHCPKKENSQVPTVSQREFECGSHECGQNTSRGLKRFGNLSAVYLDEHGPNIVFHRSINPQEVISFINENFDLIEKTGGYLPSEGFHESST